MNSFYISRDRSKMELFAAIVERWRPLAIVAKSFKLDVAEFLGLLLYNQAFFFHQKHQEYFVTPLNGWKSLNMIKSCEAKQQQQYQQQQKQIQKSLEKHHIYIYSVCQDSQPPAIVIIGNSKYETLLAQIFCLKQKKNEPFQLLQQTSNIFSSRK